MLQDSARYTYNPLLDPTTQFRVVELQPGDGPIVCNLSTRQFDSAKDSYEAISYAWGDPDDTIDISCDGKPLAITTSLHGALLNFRHGAEVRVLWADAICINQRDITEKGHQVQRMGHIYTNASAALIWIGEDDGAAKDCFQCMSEIHASIQRVISEVGGQGYITFSRVSPRVTWPKLEQAIRLLTRSWFSRLWVYQEAGLAASALVYCGRSSIQLSHVADFTIYVGFIGEQISRSEGEQIAHSLKYDVVLYRTFAAIFPGFNLAQGWQRDTKMLKRPQSSSTSAHVDSFETLIILASARVLHATDPRDRIYGFYGHARLNQLAEQVPVDYSISADELYHKVAIALLYRTKDSRQFNWGLLANVIHFEERLLTRHDLPSWVPRWDVGALPTYHKVHWYSAGGSRLDAQAGLLSTHKLHLKAVLVDAIRWVSQALPVEPNTEEHGSSQGPYPAILKRVMELNTRYVDEVQLKDAFFLTLLEAKSDLPFTERRLGAADMDRFRADYQAYLEYCHGDAHTHDAEPFTVAQCFARAITGRTRNRKLFLTDTGYFGIGPLLTGLEDKCCIVPGAGVPFVLRPTDVQGEYRLVGFCYIQDLMNGEAMYMVQQGRLIEENIILV